MKITKEGVAVIEGDNYLSKEIIEKGRLDVAKEFLEQFRQYIPAGGTVVDVGASLGDYTATFCEMVGQDGTVVAVEPNPPVNECLIHNLALLKTRPTVWISDYGLGDRSEMGAIVWDSNNVGASRIERTTGPVFMTTLDTLVGRYSLKRLDFLKIDAEGWEPLILNGGAATINQFRPVILIEVNTWPLGKMGFTAEDVFSRLDALNYKFDRFDGPYADILCIPKERT